MKGDAKLIASLHLWPRGERIFVTGRSSKGPRTVDVAIVLREIMKTRNCLPIQYFSVTAGFADDHNTPDR